MHPQRLPLLSAFAVGCLSSAALIGFFRTDDAKRPPAANQGVHDRSSEASVAPGAPTSAVPNRATPDDGSGERTAQPNREPAALDALNHSRNAAGEPAAARSSEDLNGGSPTEPGSSVADVLTHLEAGYRQALAVADQRNTAPSPGPDLSPPSPAPEPRPADREPAAPQPIGQLSETPPPRRPAREEVAVAVADPPTPPKSSPQADLQGAPMADAVPSFGPPNDGRPPDAYVADARPNINIGNIYQGDVYQVQQLAILQYIQLLAPMAGGGRAFPARSPRAGATRRPAPAPFQSSLINPDNPWGFDLHPPVLVK